MTTQLDTEIRKLQPNHFCTLSKILDESDTWKEIMGKIPSDKDDNLPLFTSEHVNMVESAIRQQQRSGAEIFLTEWSTYGKNRPTCQTMLDLLIKLQLFKAADYLAEQVLKVDRPARPSTGVAAELPIEEIEKLLNEAKLLNARAVHMDMEPESTSECSIHIIEKPMELLADCNKKVEEEFSNGTERFRMDQSYLNIMKLTQNPKSSVNYVVNSQSDLIKFNTVDGKDLIKSSESKLIENAPTSEKELVNYTFQEMPSEQIPLTVKENAFEIMKESTEALLKKSEQLESSSELDSTDDSQIPLVVKEFNQRRKCDT